MSITAAFYGCTALESIDLTGCDKLGKIGERVFYECESLTDVYYSGTEEQWNEIVIEAFNAPLKNANFHFNYTEPDTPEIVDTTKIFSDVAEGRWYTEFVNYAYTYGFFKGVSETDFRPQANVNRAMFVTVLSRIAGIEESNDVTTKFADVESGRYYTGAVKWASENGIVNGVDEMTFGVKNDITREQLCTMIVRFADYMKVTLAKSVPAMTFADDAQISNYARDAIAAYQKAGIVNGSVENGVTPCSSPKAPPPAPRRLKYLPYFTETM